MNILELRGLMRKLDYLEEEKRNWEWKLDKASDKEYKKVLKNTIKNLQEEIENILNTSIIESQHNEDN